MLNSKTEKLKYKKVMISIYEITTDLIVTSNGGLVNGGEGGDVDETPGGTWGDLVGGL